LRVNVTPPRDNRINATTPPNTGIQQNVSQLLLLDTESQIEVLQALQREASQTSGAHLSLHQSTNQHVQWLVSNWQNAKNHLERPQGSSTGYSANADIHLRTLYDSNRSLYNSVLTWLHHDAGKGSDRFRKNDAKSGNRLMAHFTNLQHGSGSKHDVTAARGEHTSAKILITVSGNNYQMKMGKTAGGGRPNGFDQIWVKRDMVNGDVLEYLLVESKGNVRGELGDTQEGGQMSARWIFICLLRMARGNGHYINTNQTNPRLATKILEAMINDRKPVKGVIFKSLYKSKDSGLEGVVEMTALGEYNCPAIFALANVAVTTPVFPPTSTQSMLFI
jgi:hypothetical protein